MNSMFSSFDILCGEFLGRTLKTSFPVSQQQQQKKTGGATTLFNNRASSVSDDNVNQKQESLPEGAQIKKMRAAPRRFALELDGLNCFETLV